MTLYGTYSANCMNEMVDDINHLHKDFLNMKRYSVPGSVIAITRILWKGE